MRTNRSQKAADPGVATGAAVEHLVGGVARLVTEVMRDAWRVSFQWHTLQATLLGSLVRRGMFWQERP